MINIENIKLAFFDLDGTLAIPRYEYNDKIRPGVSEKTWERISMDVNVYKDCGIPKAVREFVNELYYNSAIVYVVTQETWAPAFKAKLKFLTDNYPVISPDNVYYAVDNIDKYRLIEALYIKAYGEWDPPLHKSNVFYLDDDYNMVLKMNNARYDAHHISEFLEGGD